MSRLDDARKIINEEDEIIAKAFEKRMKAVSDIAKYKKENSLPIFDIDREAEILKNNKKYISDPQIRNFYVRFQKQLMDLSKEYQETVEPK